MLDKLAAINDRYKEVEKLISSPDAMNDMKLYVQLSKEYKDLDPIVKAYKEYRDLVGNIILKFLFTRPEWKACIYAVAR